MGEPEKLPVAFFWGVEMALKLAAKGAVKLVTDWPVVIQEPRNGGGVTLHKVKVDYEILSESEKDALIAEGGDAGFLSRVVHGWQDFQFEDGGDAPCNDETKATFFDVTWIVTGLLAGYFLAARGGRRKN